MEALKGHTKKISIRPGGIANLPGRINIFFFRKQIIHFILENKQINKRLIAG